ncbi:MAG: FKBP12-associated protein [Vezdaea aestivalis]|nr:MAG: FKBP12-associated protein [Vezdaea aestivalis]
MPVTCSCQHIKELVACLATSSSSGNKEKILKCTEACKELARKHQLAEALGVDIEGHTNNHVPYSVETLGIYISNSTWAATQEKIMREFAANPEEKRLRFKPMVESKKRSFLHLLAEDFGLDAESMDTVPHRHVVMYKTPRFVSAPLKTLKECAIIRKSDIQQEKMEESAALRERENARRFNALVLNHPSFGLTTDELLAKLDTATVLPRGMRWNVEFSQSEDGEVILKLETAIPGTKVTEPNLEATLRSIKGDLTLAAPKNHLAESVTLARVDVDLHVQKREDEGKANGIWSTVAAKGSNKGTKLASHVSRATKNPFMVLGSRKMAAVENETVDADWEQAAREEDHATQD